MTLCGPTDPSSVPEACVDPALVLALLSFGLVALAFREDLVPGLRRPETGRRRDRASAAGSADGRHGSGESNPGVPGAADAAPHDGPGAVTGPSDEQPDTAEAARDVAADALRLSPARPDRIADGLDGHETVQAVPDAQGGAAADDPELPRPGPFDAGASDRRLAERQTAGDLPLTAGARRRDAPGGPAPEPAPADLGAAGPAEHAPRPFNGSPAASPEAAGGPQAARLPAGGNPAGGGLRPDTTGLPPPGRAQPAAIAAAPDWPASGARSGRAEPPGDGGGAAALAPGDTAAAPALPRPEPQGLAEDEPDMRPEPSFARAETAAGTVGDEGPAPADRVPHDIPDQGPRPARNGSGMAADRTPPERIDDAALHPEPPRPVPAGTRDEPGHSAPGEDDLRKAAGLGAQPVALPVAEGSGQPLDPPHGDASPQDKERRRTDASPKPGRAVRSDRPEASGPASGPTATRPTPRDAPPLQDGGAEPGSRDGAGNAAPQGRDRIDDPAPLHVSGFRPGIDVLSIRLGPHVIAAAANGTLTLSGHPHGTDLSLRLVADDGQVLYDRRLGTLDGVRPEALKRRDFDLADLPGVTLRNAAG